jgi:uncharacterized phage-associated protein
MDLSRKESVQRMLHAFAYISKNNPNKSNMYNVLKVFYFADKMHMERYGRFIFDDNYAAMGMGPVPSDAYDMIKRIKCGLPLPYELNSPVTMSGNDVVMVQHFDEDLFSESDLECIDEVVEFSRTHDLGAESHDAAWKKCKEEGHHFMPVDYILDTLSNSQSVKNLLQNQYA